MFDSQAKNYLIYNPKMQIITPILDISFWPRTNPRNNPGSSQTWEVNFLKPLIGGKRLQADGHNHFRHIGTVDRHSNMWMHCKADNHIDTLTHCKPHRHQCHQRTKPAGNEASVWISASSACNYALWGAGPHMLANKHTDSTVSSVLT